MTAKTAAQIVKTLSRAQKDAIISGGSGFTFNLVARQRRTLVKLIVLGLAETRTDVVGTYVYLTVEGQKAFVLLTGTYYVAKAEAEAHAEDYQRAVDASVGVVTLPGRLCYAAYANGSSVEWMVRYEDKPETDRMPYVLYRNRKVYDRYSHGHAANTVWAAKVGGRGNDLEASLSR